MISKSQFLSSEHVQNFLNFLASYVRNGNKFEHGYTFRRTRTEWSCTSLNDAYRKYCYPLVSHFRKLLEAGEDHRGYEANKKVLDALKKKLLDSYANSEEKKLLDTSLDVFIWGGVAGPRNAESKKMGNYLWLKRHHPDGRGLFGRYKAAQDFFNSESPCLDDVGKEGIRSNAGFTKIYSLLFRDFIIYDSRVAAALGLFVIKYCREKQLKEIPDELNFAWMPHHGEKNTLRNASFGGLAFSKASNEKIHACSNIRANWLFGKLFDDDNLWGEFGFPKDKKNKPELMRAMEAAFFMIGYDLKGHSWLSDDRTK